MTDFPTLSKTFNRANYSQMLATDPTITSKFESGFVQSRAKFLNVSKRFSLDYSLITAEDKSLLEAFEKTVAYRAGSFNWTNPIDDQIYIVRLDNNLKFIQGRAENYWNVRVSMVEIRPNSNVNIS